MYLSAGCCVEAGVYRVLKEWAAI